MDRHKELLLICLGSEKPDSSMSRFSDIVDNDWNPLLALAVRYNVAPIVYTSLCQFSYLIEIPSDVKLAFRTFYQRSAARNMRVYKQLLDLLKIFNSERIPVILLKGVHLAEIVYGNIALRPMGDIDLLVRQRDLSKAAALLKTQGYEMSQEDVARSLKHLPPFRKKGLLDVEIHFNIVDSAMSNNFAVEELWHRAIKEQVQGVRVLTLSPEDLLLHLCLHTTVHHCFDNGILPLIDVHRTLNHYGSALDRQTAIKRSNIWGISNSLYVMLTLTEKMLGICGQTWALEMHAAEKPDFDIVETAERLVFEQAPPVSSHVARLFGSDGWSERLRVLKNRAFPPLELIAASDVSKISSFSIIKLYYRRLVGIFKRHSKHIWLGLLNQKATSDALEAQSQRNRLRDWFANG